MRCRLQVRFTLVSQRLELRLQFSLGISQQAFPLLSTGWLPVVLRLKLSLFSHVDSRCKSSRFQSDWNYLGSMPISEPIAFSRRRNNIHPIMPRWHAWTGLAPQLHLGCLEEGWIPAQRRGCWYQKKGGGDQRRLLYMLVGQSPIFVFVLFCFTRSKEVLDLEELWE